MADKTLIEWTEKTWNPIAGCDVVSPGCTDCYAMRRVAPRLAANPATPHYAGTVKKTKAGYVWTGKIGVASDRTLLQPLSWKRPAMCFVNSTSDLFHKSVPDEVRDRIFAVMALTPHITYQILTKRHEEMRDYLSSQDTMERIYSLVCDLAVGMRLNVTLIADPRHAAMAPPGPRIFLGLWPLKNVWLGLSVEDQRHANLRIPVLLETPAAIRFISAEPLLEAIDLEAICNGFYFVDALRGRKYHDVPDPCISTSDPCPKIDWVIVGGETGKNARPMDPRAARYMRDQCLQAGVAYFFKQWGEFLPVGQVLPSFGKVHDGSAVIPGRMKLHYGGTPQKHPEYAFAEKGVTFSHTPDGRITFRVGKPAAGRLLDGVEHNGMPEIAA